MSKNASVGTQTLRVTPALLKDLRMLRVAVFHPDDADGAQLVQQLQRIGCQVQAFWPPLPPLRAVLNVISGYMSAGRLIAVNLQGNRITWNLH